MIITFFFLHRQIIIGDKHYSSVSRDTWGCWKKLCAQAWKEGWAKYSMFQGGWSVEVTV